MQHALKFCKSYAVFYNFHLGKLTEQDKIFRAGDAHPRVDDLSFSLFISVR